MTQYFHIIVEQESNGAFSAWVAGLPGVYAAADTAAVAKRAIRGALLRISTRCAHSAASRIDARKPAAQDSPGPVRQTEGAFERRHLPVDGRVRVAGAFLRGLVGGNDH